MRERVEALAALVVLVTAGSTAWYAIALGRFTTGQTTGSGLPLELTFYPMGVGAVCMTVFALARVLGRDVRDLAAALAIALALAAAGWAWSRLAAGVTSPSGPPMLAAFVGCVIGGVPIGFALAFTALIFIWLGGMLPGLIFAQQMARGIDTFVLLAIPFFILVGYLMEANGMSVRLIALLERLVGRAARRAQRRHGFVHGDLLGHFRLEDGRRRRGGLGAHSGGSARAAESRRRRRIAGGLGGDGGDDSAVHQSDHSRLRRQPFDRRPVHGGIVAGGTDGARPDRGGDPVRRRRPVPGGGGRGQDAARQALGRRGGHVGAAGDHLRRLPIGDRDRDRDFLIRRLLRAGGWRAGVPRVGTARRGAQFRPGGHPRGTGAVHRRRGAVALVRADPAANSAGAGAGDDRAFARGRRVAVPAALDPDPDRDGFGAGGRGGADHLRALAAARRDGYRHRRPALRRGAGHRDGHRPVRAPARARPLRRLPDRRGPDRGHDQADAGLSRIAAGVRARDRVRPRVDDVAAAGCSGISEGRNLPSPALRGRGLG